MSSYPSRVKRFTLWSKAMVQGATVGNPDYDSSRSETISRKPVKAKRRRRRRKKNHGSKD